MEVILFELVAYYFPQIMEGGLYIFAIILGILAAKYVKPLLQNKVVEVLARNAVLFVEQVYKDLHGDDKLNMALERLSTSLRKWKINITVDEMRFMLEAAVGKFNDAFNRKVIVDPDMD